MNIVAKRSMLLLPTRKLPAWIQIAAWLQKEQIKLLLGASTDKQSGEGDSLRRFKQEHV